MDEFQEPEDLAVKANVVNDLDVVRVRAPLEQEASERIAVRMRRSVFLSLADDADQRRVPAAARHEVCVGVSTPVEQRTRDGNGVLVRGFVVETREGEEQQRLPVL